MAHARLSRFASGRGFAAAGLGALLQVLGCAHPERIPASVSAPVVPLAPGTDPLREPTTRFERVVLRRMRLSLPIPDPAGWKPIPGRSRFVQLAHEGTRSSIVVGTSLENERVDARRCEDNARLYRDFPRGGERLSEEKRTIAGFDSVLRVAVLPGSTPRGYLTAFGVKGRHCLTFAFVTEAAGPDARQAVEERLALIDQRTLNAIIPVDPNEAAGTAQP